MQSTLLVVTCDDPTPINGQTNPPSVFNGTYFTGSNVTFSCDPGFMISGSAFSVCQENKTWSQQPPLCTKGNEINTQHMSKYQVI